MRDRCALRKYLLISALLAVELCPAYWGPTSFAESRDIAPIETPESAERLARGILDTSGIHGGLIAHIGCGSITCVIVIATCIARQHIIAETQRDTAII